MQQIYRKTPMPKCDFKKIALQLSWNRTSAWMFSCKFTAYFPRTPLDGCFWKREKRENIILAFSDQTIQLFYKKFENYKEKTLEKWNLC